MPPSRPSFLHPLAVHPENDRFFTPLFSMTSELLFSQPLCFHNHLRCPLVFRCADQTSTPAALSPFPSYYIRANPAASYDYALFRATAPAYPFHFQSLAHSFYRNGGGTPQPFNRRRVSVVPREAFRLHGTQKVRLFRSKGGDRNQQSRSLQQTPMALYIFQV